MTTTPKPAQPVTVRALRAAARGIPAADRLDKLIDAKPAEAARLIMSTDPDTARELLLAAVTGVHRRYRVPAALPAEPVERERETDDRMRRVIADILTEHPGAIGPAALAVTDAARAVGERERAA